MAGSRKTMKASMMTNVNVRRFRGKMHEIKDADGVVGEIEEEEEEEALSSVIGSSAGGWRSTGSGQLKVIQGDQSQLAKTIKLLLLNAISK